MKSFRLIFSIVAVAAFVTTVTDAATITVINKDPAGTGFNDPTVVAPVGGNAGTTLGQQRLNVFQAAANVWGAKLSSPFTIKITAHFQSMSPCDTVQGILGSAGPVGFVSDEAGLPLAGTLYPLALASALTGTDWAVFYGVADGASINAQFNSDVGLPGCLPSTGGWYLGLDAAHGSQVDLETVVLHEFGHGLGFTGMVSTTDGSNILGQPDIFSVMTHDNSTSLYWNTMSNAQRLTSMVNNGNVVFDGTHANTAAAAILTVGKDGSNRFKLFMPATVQTGSSIYHVDTTASPNQLMEPVINGDLTHNVDTPNDVAARVMQDLGWPQPSSLAAPASLAVTAASASSVSLSWNSVVGATSYHIYRSNDNATYTQLGGNNVPTTFTDSTASTGKAYLYKVRAFNGSVESSDSNKDLAYAFTFTDPTLTSFVTKIKAAHITEVRTAVNAIRAQLLGLPTALTYTTDNVITAATTKVKAAHITELRTAITAVRAALSVPVTTYTNTITQNVTGVKKADITDLRLGVQ